MSVYRTVRAKLPAADSLPGRLCALEGRLRDARARRDWSEALRLEREVGAVRREMHDALRPARVSRKRGGRM